jgi:TolA-binding protein
VSTALRNDLIRAQAALSRRELREAQNRAEALLQSRRMPPDMVAAALLVAADAAYGMRWYGRAAVRYDEYLSLQPTGPDAARVAFHSGWAHLRDGRRDAARLAWERMADAYPADPRAPLALVLASELARRSGDTQAAGALLDRVIARYPSSVHTGTARLDRSIMALRAQREEAGVRDLDEVVRSHGPSAIELRRKTLQALAVPGAELALETPPAMRAFAPGARFTAERASTVTLSTDEPLGRFASAFLQSGDRDAPYVLHGLSLIGTIDRGWSDSVVAALVQRLVDGWPSYPAAPGLLARVATSAASTGQWPIARRAYDTLAARYPGSPVAASTRMDIADALVRAGAEKEARAYLKDAIAAGGYTAPRALQLLAEVEEAAGNRREALTAYDRLLREHPGAERSAGSLLAHARLLESFGQPERARALLQRIVTASSGEVAGEASYRLAKTLSAQGQDAAAVEWYLTAAYTAEGSRWERPSLLGAARSLTALGRTGEALVVYRKLTSLPTGAADDTVPAAAASPSLAPERRDREAGAEALRLADTLQDAGDHKAALEMYMTAAYVTAGGPTEARALLGALRSLVASGDRPSAEAIYRRLESSKPDAAVLAEARKAISAASH